MRAPSSTQSEVDSAVASPSVRRDPAYRTHDGALLYTLAVQVEYRIRDGHVFVRVVTVTTDPAEPGFADVLERYTRTSGNGQPRVAVEAWLRFTICQATADGQRCQALRHRFNGFVDQAGLAGGFTLGPG